MAQKFLSGLQTTIGSVGTPGISFVGYADTGFYRTTYDTSKDALDIAVDGVRRARIFEAGIQAFGNLYFDGDVRTFGSLWHATTGATGAGFAFSNTADSTDALTLSSTGTAVFGGTVTANGVLLTGNQTLPSDFVSAANGGTFAAPITVTGGGNTLHLKKGTGNPAIAFGGTSNEASFLIEGIAGGGGKFYTSTSVAGTMADPGWSAKLTITGAGAATFASTIAASNFSGTHSGASTNTNTGDQTLPTDFVSKASGGTFENTITIADAIDGDFTALRLMNQKTYGSGTGTNERVRFVMGLSESGIAISGREGFAIDFRIAAEGDSSDGIVDFKVRDGGTLGTYSTVTGSNKSVSFVGNVIASADLNVNSTFTWAKNIASAYTYSAADASGMYIERVSTAGAGSTKADIRLQARDNNSGGYTALSIKGSDGTINLTAANTTISGNLTVNGTQTILNTTTVEVEDNILQLNTTQGSPDTATAATSGISIYRGDGNTQASLIFDDADDTWDLNYNMNFFGQVKLTSGTSGTTSKLLFKTTDNNDESAFIQKEAYWMRLSAHQNEGFKFTDTTNSTILLKLNGGASSSGNGINSATFLGNVYAPRFYGPLTGNVTGNVSGSSGSCTGNAATATLADDAHYIKAQDNRIISPSEHTAVKMRFGFTSWNNDNGSPYADFLHMRSYSDSSGGADNLVMFKKSGIGMRIWQQAYGSSTAYASYENVYSTPYEHKQNNTDVDSGATRIIAEIIKDNHHAIFFDYLIKKGTNVRAGTLTVCHDGTLVEYAETSTVDLGDTSEVVLSASILNTKIRLIAETVSNDWSIKSLIRAI